MKKLTLSLITLVASIAFAAPSAQKDIVDTAVGAGQFNTLVAAVQAAGLVETLKSEGPFTVFAPTDDAFAALPEGTVENLLKPENIDTLKNILLYHVAGGALKSNDLLEKSALKTVFGKDVKIEMTEEGLFINNAKVLVENIETSNGVIQVIDAVLLP